jgi:cellulose synthase/poly-beta-1,6-N-acetylglucosamine synthase-like glycosyltransferase
MTELVAGLYLIAVSGLVVFGFHRLKLICSCRRGLKGSRTPDRGLPGLPAQTPKVCIQCPVFNEPLVVTDLLEAVAAIDWPEACLEIQILDDSTDETSEIITRWLDEHPWKAVVMRHLQRSERIGFKAGALAEGMARSDAAFFAIFDADFRPRRDFLQVALAPFDRPEVGLVQARWVFNNRSRNLLTRLQAVFLDAHFVVEQAARARQELFFNFNGTAGVWRRTALEQAGGWSADTVTEDLDISYRAQIAGWRFVYLEDYTVSSELPERLIDFKIQQQRWTKGGIQVMRKLLPNLLRSSVSPSVKFEGFFHLTIGLVHFFVVLFALVFVPYLVLFGAAPQGVFWFVHPVVLLFAGGSAVLLYLAGQYGRTHRSMERVRIVLAAPLILSFGLAMGVTCLWAVIEGLFTRGGEFVRTPKGGQAVGLVSVSTAPPIRAPLWIQAGLELGFALLVISAAVWFLNRASPWLSLLLVVKSTGFFALISWFLRDSIRFGGSVRKTTSGVEIAPVLDS